MYNIIVNGMPTNLSSTNNTIAANKKTKRISLPFHLKCLNFRENNGSSATSRKLNIVDSAINKYGFTNSLKFELYSE